MKVYVVTQGCYSDYHICCVVADKELAKKLAVRYSDYYDIAIVEEYDIDAEEYKETRFNKIYHLEFDEKLNVLEVREVSADDVSERLRGVQERQDGGYYLESVFANDEDGAIKIAKDKIAEYKAGQEWLW